MKKYLLLLVITLGISVMTSAQNYTGKTKNQITAILDDKGIDYEVYYTAQGDEGIRYEFNDEKRVYLIGVAGVCDWYMVLSNSQAFMYNMRRYATSNGFRESSVTDDYTYTYKKGVSKIIVGPCPEEEDAESAFYGWTFFLIYKAN